MIGGSINIITNSKSENPLCFTAQEDNATLGMIGPYNWQTDSRDVTASLQISKDEQNTWTQWDGSVVTLNKYEKLYVKALNPNTNGFYNSIFTSNHAFVIKNGKVAASGNIQYLLNSTGEGTDVLPANCYAYMFDGCTSLTSAPELPATTLNNQCYQYMFSGCTSLTQAPVLQATTLASDCYSNMFSGCTNITSVTMKNDVNPYDSSKYGTLGDNITINYV